MKAWRLLSAAAVLVSVFVWLLAALSSWYQSPCPAARAPRRCPTHLHCACRAAGT